MPWIIGIAVFGLFSLIGNALEGEAEDRYERANARFEEKMHQGRMADESCNRARADYDRARTSAGRTAERCRRSMGE